MHFPPPCGDFDVWTEMVVGPQSFVLEGNSIMRVLWCRLIGRTRGATFLLVSFVETELTCQQLRMKTVKNGRKKPLTIFARTSFYSVGDGNRKVRNEIRSVKSGPSKTDKSEQKCLGIDRQTVI
jgi:hypothetical protein